MGQVRLNMTGEEFKKLIEQKNPDGIVDTLQEVFALFEGIGDDETLAEYVQRTAKEAIDGLGELSKKDNATGSVTASGTNASSSVSLSGEVKQKMVTKDVKEVDSFNAGTSPSLSYDETNRKLTFSSGTQSSLTTKSTTVATGTVSTEGTGAEVVTQSNNAGTAEAQVFTGAAVNVTVS